MSSLIAAAIFSLAGLALSIGFVRALSSDARRDRAASPFVRVLRWGLRCLALCCAITTWVVLCVAWHTLLTRRLDGAIEASLATRLAFYYPTLGGAALVWLARRVPEHWFRPRYRGPLLLPPGNPPPAE